MPPLRRESLPADRLPPGPVALVFAEDATLLAETVDWARARGFAAAWLFRDPAHALPAREGLVQTDLAVTGREDVAAALGPALRALRGRWVHVCFNAEFLFFPCCETRRVGDLAAFMEEERRAAVWGLTVDLYTDEGLPGAAALAPGGALLDAMGWFAEERWEGGLRLERQPVIRGGLALRAEEHVPEPVRDRGRPLLFRADPGVAVSADLRLSDPELNTVNCPWHRNVTAALASFRIAKALRRNPDSAAMTGGLAWAGSAPFGWSSAELLERGFMEAGQWF